MTRSNKTDETASAAGDPMGDPATKAQKQAAMAQRKAANQQQRADRKAQRQAERALKKPKTEAPEAVTADDKAADQPVAATAKATQAKTEPAKRAPRKAPAATAPAATAPAETPVAPKKPATKKPATTKTTTAKTTVAKTTPAKTAETKPATAKATAPKAPAKAAAKPATKPRAAAKPAPFNIMIVAQAGRLQFEALVFAASLRRNAPNFTGAFIVAEPQPSSHWDSDPRISPQIRAILEDTYGARIVPFTNRDFGQSYPYGNKIEALSALPAGENFIFFDTDTLILGDISTAQIDFSRPTASMRREGTWPVEEVYWPGYTAIWKSLYDKFGIPFDATLDLSEPDEYWERYLYFNAGWFTGSDPAAFEAYFREYACGIRDNAPEELVIQPLHPWLDQVALPLVIAKLGGGRPGPEMDGFDGALTCHYRTLPLLYAREDGATIAAFEGIVKDDAIREVLKTYPAFDKMVFQNQGAKVQALFDKNKPPRNEQRYRQRIKAEGLWIR